MSDYLAESAKAAKVTSMKQAKQHDENEDYKIETSELVDWEQEDMKPQYAQAVAPQA